MRLLALFGPLFLAWTPKEGNPPLAFHLSLNRLSTGDLVVATATNVGTREIDMWGKFAYLGGYQPSAGTERHYGAIRDSMIRAAASKTNGAPSRDGCQRPPTYYILSALLDSEPLKRIVLRPGEAYSDTLELTYYRLDFVDWPGYIDLTCEFFMGARSDDVAGAIRIRKPNLRIAVPVP
jgi:hypothetical protein